MSYAQPVTDFGHGIGVDGLALDHAGLAQLRLDAGCMLTFEATDAALLVYLTAPAPFVELPRLLTALKAVHAREHDGPPLQLGLRGRGNDASLVVLTRLVGRHLGGSDIARAVEVLLGWHAQWAAS